MTKLVAVFAFIFISAGFSPAFADEPTPTAEELPSLPPVEPAKENTSPASPPVEPPKATASSTPVVADAAKPSMASPWGFHGGINLRTDLGAHPFRIDGGVRYKQLDFILVLDPMYLMDKQSSTDLLSEWRGKNGFSPLLGWRFNTIGLIDGSQVQHNLLLGGALDTPKFWDGHVRGQAGLELAMMLVKHGGGGPVETIGFSSGRRFVDFVNFSLFLRIEIGTKD